MHTAHRTVLASPALRCTYPLYTARHVEGHWLSTGCIAYTRHTHCPSLHLHNHCTPFAHTAPHIHLHTHCTFVPCHLPKPCPPYSFAHPCASEHTLSCTFAHPGPQCPSSHPQPHVHYPFTHTHTPTAAPRAFPTHCAPLGTPCALARPGRPRTRTHPARSFHPQALALAVLCFVSADSGPPRPRL